MLSHIKTDSVLTVGVIANSFGIKGIVKIKPLAVESDLLLDINTVYLYKNDIWVDYKIEECFFRNKLIYIKFQHVNSIDEALKLKTVMLGILKEDLPPLENNEYYSKDLVGLIVFNKEKMKLGVIENVLDAPANDVLVIKGEKEHMIPFVSKYVLNVDIKNQNVTVDWGIDY